MKNNNIIVLICFILISINGFSQSKDKGIGVLFLKSSLPDSQTKLDSVCIYDSTLSKTIGIYMYLPDDINSIFQIKSKHIVENCLFEFEYETKGLPIQELEKNSFKIIIGTDSLNNPVMGWVKYNSKSLGYYLWEDYLLKKELYFSDSPSMYQFYKTPHGEKKIIDLIKDDSEYSQYLEKEFIFNYIMHPIKKEGKWLKVEVVTPSDYCDEVLKPKKEVLWIRYLDDKGRPLVWYYTRGC